MPEERFHRRQAAWRDRGERTAFVLAALAEALDEIERLRGLRVGGETVSRRQGEFKSWDAEVFRVDQEIEDGFLRRLQSLGTPLTLLSEEAGRVVVGEGPPQLYAVADPFDGSWLLKRGIRDFWYSSLALFDAERRPVCCAVADAVHGTVAFADASGARLARLEGDRLADCVTVDRAYRASMGRPDVTDPAQAGIESYAMKPARFLLPLVDTYRVVLEPFKFFLPNGGPYGFVDVALGRVDVYFAPRQPFVDVFSGIQIAEQAGAMVTDFSGRPVTLDDEPESLHDVLATTNRALHERVLDLIARCR